MANKHFFRGLLKCINNVQKIIFYLELANGLQEQQTSLMVAPMIVNTVTVRKWASALTDLPRKVGNLKKFA